MNVDSIKQELAKEYGDKAVFLNEVNGSVTEMICELEPTSEHSDYSTAIAIIDKSEPHYHQLTTEKYKIIKGKLTLHVGEQQIELQEKDEYTIIPTSIHWAEGNETWVEVSSKPGWTIDDHIIASRKRLTEMLKTGDEFNIFKGDVKSFQYLRTDGFSVLSVHSLGGGNLAIALIAVTQLDLLGQCYVILSNQVKRNSRGDIDQTDAFLKLVKDSVSNWGYTEDEVKTFWKRVRHKLVNQSYPKATILVPKPEDYKTMKELQDYANQNAAKSFYFDGDLVVVLADALIQSVENIKGQIAQRLENGDFDDSQIGEAIKFIIE